MRISTASLFSFGLLFTASCVQAIGYEDFKQQDGGKFSFSTASSGGGGAGGASSSSSVASGTGGAGGSGGASSSSTGGDVCTVACQVKAPTDPNQKPSPYVGSYCKVCQDDGTCLPTCENGLLDPTESDVDCGGPCTPCPAQKQCRQGCDCYDGCCAFGSCDLIGALKLGCDATCKAPCTSVGEAPSTSSSSSSGVGGSSSSTSGTGGSASASTSSTSSSSATSTTASSSTGG